MWNQLRCVVWFLLCLILVSCGKERSSESELDAFPNLAARWDSPTIPVCWEESASPFDLERQWLQDKVEGQYEGVTPIEFTGWDACESSSFQDQKGIRIGVDGENPHTKGLGRSLSGVKNGMMLNFEFLSWSPSCQRDRQRCIEGIGVHEFGHALGLAHEQNRPDTPSTCQQGRQGTGGNVTIGAWDLNSVMNYCNPVYNNNGNLTETDIAGINYMYAEAP